MRASQTIKMSGRFLPAAALFLAGILQASAQQNPIPPPARNIPPARTTTTTAAPNKKTPGDLQNADVLIIANVTARELKIEIVPDPKVEFPGKPERETLWESDRQNLPASIEPGVTYRNIGIQLRIASRFADIERIVAEALGEIPVSDDSPDKQTAPPATEPQQPAIEISLSVPDKPGQKKAKRRR